MRCQKVSWKISAFFFTKFTFIAKFSVASQIYKTSSHEEYIITGNDALMKCVIPSFVADFVSVIQWEDSEGNTYIKDSTIMGNEQ